MSVYCDIEHIMDKDINPFPEMHVISLPEKLCKLGHFLTDQFRHVGISEHRGGAAMLDRELYDKLGETHDGIQQELDYD